MADSYIDPRETLIYGAFARDQFGAVCLGLVPGLDSTVHFATAAQATADAAMKKVLDRQPAAPKTEGDPQADARDSVVRFGKYVESIKGRPVELKVFFDREAPSIAARRRLLKLVALVEHIAKTVDAHKNSLPGFQMWIDEFRGHHAALTGLEQGSRSSKVAGALLRPELAAAREAWLAVYIANKALITGVLRHAGKLELLPLVFDDLAEQHRTTGVSDDAPAPAPAGDAPTS